MRLLKVDRSLSAKQKPAFIITIDTEGDNIWARPRTVTTHNARYLQRFQELCERFNFRPTYLVNFEMANDDYFVQFGRAVIQKRTAEIGMHLHAWDTPPISSISDRDWYYQPYAFEYPLALVAEKARTMTELLETRFDVKITSHRAGRFGFDDEYAKILASLGYRADCSVTPLVDWCSHLGSPHGRGGPDFTKQQSSCYYIGTKPGDAEPSSLLEVPVTIMKGKRSFAKNAVRLLLARRGDKIVWLRPNGKNLSDLLFIVRAALNESRSFIQFTLHSSEFMPGGSPTFKSLRSIDRLFNHLEILFSAIKEEFEGMTLTEFADSVLASRSTS